MLRLVDGLLAGGLIAGVIWYTRRDQRKAESEANAAARLARLAEARVQFAAAAAQGDRAIAAGNTAGAAVREGRKPAPPAAPPQAPLPTVNPARPAEAAPIKPPAGLTRRFDDLFAVHGSGIPVPYLRALANAESGMRPDDRLGLINVVPIALADYNRRHPNAPIKPEQMRDPASNIRVAADILRTIIESYQRNHRDVPNLVEAWSNGRFVELLTAGWNAGYSELAGVGRVVNFLKTPPVVVRPAEITIDSVFDAAWRARASEHLSNRRKLAYAKGVAATYVREVERDKRNLG